MTISGRIEPYQMSIERGRDDLPHGLVLVLSMLVCCALGSRVVLEALAHDLTAASNGRVKLLLVLAIAVDPSARPCHGVWGGFRTEIGQTGAR